MKLLSSRKFRLYPTKTDNYTKLISCFKYCLYHSKTPVFQRGRLNFFSIDLLIKIVFYRAGSNQLHIITPSYNKT